MDLTRTETIDPGVHCIYVATWCGSELRSVVKSINWERNADMIVIECPTLYQGRVANVDQRDVLNLVRTVERVKCLSIYDHWWEILPRQWNGGDKKWKTHGQVLRRLLPAELEIVRKVCGQDIEEYVRKANETAALGKKPVYKREGHNLLDAIGIGLDHFGRLR